jgi:uncharacterized protein YkwD
MRGSRRVLAPTALAAVFALAGCVGGRPGTVVSTSGVPEVGAQLNAARSELGLSRLAPSPALADAAMAQARFTAERGELTHRSARGGTVMDRVKSRGYRACLAAENLAAGQADAAEVTRGWLASPGHRGNMRLRDATHYGAGRANVDGGSPYWVLVVAAPCT